jgi:hypothetical protein
MYLHGFRTLPRKHVRRESNDKCNNVFFCLFFFHTPLVISSTSAEPREQNYVPRFVNAAGRQQVFLVDPLT